MAKFCLCSLDMGIQDSNEADILAILEILQISFQSFQGMLLVESDSSNAVGWMLTTSARHWRDYVVVFKFTGRVSSHG